MNKLIIASSKQVIEKLTKTAMVSNDDAETAADEQLSPAASSKVTRLSAANAAQKKSLCPSNNPTMRQRKIILTRNAKDNAEESSETQKLKQPTINSVLKTLPKGITIKNSPTTATTTKEAKPEEKPKPAEATLPTLPENSNDSEKKTKKVQRLTVTKAEAAAMLKDGRLRFKDGNMILTTTVSKSAQ